jgi:hypothetical protein
MEYYKHEGITGIVKDAKMILNEELPDEIARKVGEVREKIRLNDMLFSLATNKLMKAHEDDRKIVNSKEIGKKETEKIRERLIILRTV